MFFEKDLILDVKTTLRLQKSHCEKLFDIKNKGCKCYLGNFGDKFGSFLVLSRSDVEFGSEHPFFCVPEKLGALEEISPPLVRIE